MAEFKKNGVISIHAPTRGATSNCPYCGRFLTISIHAPTRGATNTDDACTDGLHISIHAPTRGATAKMHNIPYASLQ